MRFQPVFAVAVWAYRRPPNPCPSMETPHAVVSREVPHRHGAVPRADAARPDRAVRDLRADAGRGHPPRFEDVDTGRYGHGAGSDAHVHPPRTPPPRPPARSVPPVSHPTARAFVIRWFRPPTT